MLNSPRVEGELNLRRIAAQIIIASICSTEKGYPQKLAPVSRGWSDGPFWHLIPSNYSDMLLDYCLKGEPEYQVELLVSGAESLVFRTARPEQAEALMRKVLKLDDPAETEEEESNKEAKEGERDEQAEAYTEVKKPKKKKRK